MRQLEELASEATKPLGLEVVEIAMRGSGSRRLLRVDIDRPGPSGVSLEDCKTVSRDLERILESADLLHGPYVLEVSSPGIDRPIRTPTDVRRNTGRRVLVRTAVLIAGRNEFRGTLQGMDANGHVVIVDDELGDVAIPWEQVATARQDVVFASGGVRH